MADFIDDISSVESIPIANRVAETSGLKGSAWLDSSLIVADRGTRSLYADNPTLELFLSRGVLTLATDGKLFRSASGTRDVLSLLDKIVKEGNRVAIGFISYEASLEFLDLPRLKPADTPDLHFFVYNHVNWFPHTDRTTYHTRSEPQHEALTNRLDLGIQSGKVGRVEFGPYQRKVERIKKHIFEGDIYQANLTHRFEIPSPVPPIQVYRNLRRLNPSPYGALINFGDYQVLSSSPERMFLRQGDFVTTGPIKGTIHRGNNDSQDRDNARQLRFSEKDLAEHLMIVDLERNDLGRIAQTGAVRVDELFRPELYSSVIHLTSDISAKLKPGCSFAELCEAMLPGGSITGAPKHRAVEILHEIEDTPRGIYTGCIGYLTAHPADFNIAIRTIVRQNGLYHVHAGGGIVADSTAELEFREMLLKAQNMFRALELDPPK